MPKLLENKDGFRVDMSDNLFFTLMGLFNHSLTKVKLFERTKLKSLSVEWYITDLQESEKLHSKNSFENEGTRYRRMSKLYSAGLHTYRTTPPHST